MKVCLSCRSPTQKCAGRSPPLMRARRCEPGCRAPNAAAPDPAGPERARRTRRPQVGVAETVAAQGLAVALAGEQQINRSASPSSTAWTTTSARAITSRRQQPGKMASFDHERTPSASRRSWWASRPDQARPVSTTSAWVASGSIQCIDCTARTTSADPSSRPASWPHPSMNRTPGQPRRDDPAHVGRRLHPNRALPARAGRGSASIASAGTGSISTDATEDRS